MAKIITVSPSLLNTFLTCPRQYYGKYETHEIKFVPNEAAEKGTRIHKAIELGLAQKDTLPSEASMVAEYISSIHKAREAGCRLFVEHEMAITKDFKPTTWKAKDAWLRAKVDVLLVNGNSAIIVDWKTGKVWNDPVQAAICSLVTWVTTGCTDIHCYWEYILQGKSTYTHYDMKDLGQFSELFGQIKEYENACQLDLFPPKPGRLCKKWCGMESCEYKGK